MTVINAHKLYIGFLIQTITLYNNKTYSAEFRPASGCLQCLYGVLSHLEAESNPYNTPGLVFFQNLYLEQYQETLFMYLSTKQGNAREV
jgi:hypothetical protein